MQTAHLDIPPGPPAALPRFSAVLQGGADAVHAVLAAAGPGTRVVRVGNPLRAPLTIERILIQSGQMEAGLMTDDAADQAMHRLCHRRDGEARVLLAIDQADTLSPAALRTLVRIAAPSGPPRPPQGGLQADLHIVFIGTPAFAGLLAAPGLEPLRDALPHLPDQSNTHPVAAPAPDPIPPLPGPAVAQAIPAEAPAAPAQPAPVPPSPPIQDRAHATARHLAMMADVMPSRATAPETPAPVPMPPHQDSVAAVARAPRTAPMPRRGRSRVLAALLLLAVVAGAALVVAARPDVQERLGIQDLVGQVVGRVQDALHRLRV